jgi:hypothetical protein
MPAEFIILCCKSVSPGPATIHTSISMTRKKNISKTWQANLPKWPPKHTPVSRKPTVDDVTDSELESDFDFKDLEVESEEEMESGDEDITLKEIQSDVELLEFAMRLQEAHDWMVTEEKAKRAHNSRKWMRWKSKWQHALMTSHCCRSEGTDFEIIFDQIADSRFLINQVC